jgi:hypothetical protein
VSDAPILPFFNPDRELCDTAGCDRLATKRQRIGQVQQRLYCTRCAAKVVEPDAMTETDYRDVRADAAYDLARGK